MLIRTLVYPILFLMSFYSSAQKSVLQQYYKLAATAQDHYNQKHYQASVNLYQQAFEIKNDQCYDLYSAACSATLAKQNELALQWLRQAVEHGYLNIRHMKNDTDLKGLHGTKQYRKFLKNMQIKVDQIESDYDKPLQRQLLAIFEQDQECRLKSNQIGQKYGFESKEMNALWKTIERADSINLTKVTAILDKRGWVGPHRIGAQANSTLFLVIQHADLQTQQKYLPMMRQAVASKNAQASQLALLEDRVAVG